MNPDQSISDLDRYLASDGEDVRIRAATAPATEVGKSVRAFVRGYRPDELAGGVQQGDREAIISPTGLAAAGLPSLDRNMRLQVGDRWTNIMFANPVRQRGKIVRWNVWLRG